MTAQAIGTRLHDLGLPAWIAIMVLGFIVWWPLGLAALFFLIWSGRMSCHGRGSAHWDRKMERMQERMDWMRSRMQGGGSGGGPFWGSSSGNTAFDEYKAETLRRLEEEQKEFREFLNRLRTSKDRAEFDQFMADRRRNGSDPAPQQG